MIAIFLALLSQPLPWTPPGMRPAIELTTLIQPADCSSTRCDLAPAFERAQQMIEAQAPTAAPQLAVQGGLFTIAPGDYNLRSTVVLRRAHSIRGAGGALWGAATILRATTATSAIVVMAKAQGAMISDLALITAVQPTSSPRYGIRLDGRADLERLLIRGFTQGLRIYGRAASGTNVNGARIHGVRIESSEHAGLFVGGADGNANTFDAIDIASSCQRASKWPSLGPCASVVDASFLGNTFIGAQTAGAREPAINEFYPGYAFIGGSQRSVCVGCYAEQDQKRGQMSQWTDIIGGLGGWEGPGLRLEGQRANGLRIYGVPAAGDSQPPELILGQQASLPGSVEALMPPQTGGQVLPNGVLRRRLITGPAGKKSWIEDVAGLGIGVARRVSLEPGRYGVTTIKTSTLSTP